MKQVRIPLIWLVLLGTTIAASAQDKSIINAEIIASKNFVFTAQFAQPQRGGNIPLTSTYDLTIRHDTVTAYLPFFGRAYTAPINSEGGIKFTSTKNDYKAVKKSNRWDITIQPQDESSTQQLYLTVFENGSASLQVISTNKQSMSFNGYVSEGKPLNKRAF